MPALDSSMMERVDYRDTERELDITFVGGETYTYFGVAQRIYDELLTAESKGRLLPRSHRRHISLRPSQTPLGRLTDRMCARLEREDASHFP